jgi:hypothetical protein
MKFASKILKIVLIGLSIVSGEGCGREKKSKPGEEILSAIRHKRDSYIRFFLESATDEKGWPIDTNCDGLLFASLGKSSGLPIPLDLAHGPTRGRWYRNWQRDCSTDISRDQILGLMVWLWHSRDLPRVDDLISFGEANDWRMGEGPDSRVLMSPLGQGTLYQIRYRLGGADHGKRHIRGPWLPMEGYQAHLQMLHAWLRQRVGITDQTARLAVKEMAEREKNNALFHAIASEFSESSLNYAAKILASNPVFPDGSLPTSDHKCSAYLWERNEFHGAEKNDDWLPCTDGTFRQYSGIDYIFAATLILGEI